MNNRRNKPVNRWGCKPTEDVCVEHDRPLECPHGCKQAKKHKCKWTKHLDSRICAMTARKTKPIPILAAKKIAEAYGYDQVVVMARKVDPNGIEHVTTYGIDKEHCEVAARMGNYLKHKIMGWPEPA